MAALALVIILAGTALAGTGVGAVFNLGRTNAVDALSILTGATASSMLRVTNTGSGTALDLRPGSGKPPFTTTSDVKVPNLNADRIDSLDSSTLQRRVASSCTVGSSIRAIGANGTVTCQAAARRTRLTSDIDRNTSTPMTEVQYATLSFTQPAGHALTGILFEATATVPSTCDHYLGAYPGEGRIEVKLAGDGFGYQAFSQWSASTANLDVTMRGGYLLGRVAPTSDTTHQLSLRIWDNCADPSNYTFRSFRADALLVP